jgi:hypothetical protein
MSRRRYRTAAVAAVLASSAAASAACPSDVNGDGATDIDDLVAVVLDWGTDGAANGTDVNGDGVVDVDDVVDLILAWGPADCPGDIVIDFWYGDEPSFGAPGRPQEQVNILGNVSAVNGLDALVFSVNAGPDRPLAVGPDTRRLAAPGDFNIELFYSELVVGANDVVVRATDNSGGEQIETIVLDLAAPQVWPLPYAVDWSTVTDIQDVVNVVDGVWALTDGGLRCTVPDYDRLVVLGDITWTDYEITVPVTVHGVDESGYEFPSILPGVGFILRWPGHSDNFDAGAQPNQGWWPFGAVAEYVFRLTGCLGRFELYGNPFVLRDEDEGCGLQVAFDETWIWKMRVTTQGPTGSLYQFKAWRQDDPEPADWLLSSLESPQELGAGCLGLLAHHVDVTFGDIAVVGVSAEAVEGRGGAEGPRDRGTEGLSD